jgi:hypothetical protein
VLPAVEHDAHLIGCMSYVVGTNVKRNAMIECRKLHALLLLGAVMTMPLMARPSMVLPIV